MIYKQTRFEIVGIYHTLEGSRTHLGCQYLQTNSFTNRKTYREREKHKQMYVGSKKREVYRQT